MTASSRVDLALKVGGKGSMFTCKVLVFSSCGFSKTTVNTEYREEALIIATETTMRNFKGTALTVFDAGNALKTERHLRPMSTNLSPSSSIRTSRAISCFHRSRWKSIQIPLILAVGCSAKSANHSRSRWLFRGSSPVSVAVH